MFNIDVDGYVYVMYSFINSGFLEYLLVMFSVFLVLGDVGDLGGGVGVVIYVLDRLLNMCLGVCVGGGESLWWLLMI